ncbi:MAG: hypothetical protein K9N48_06670 [Verrucomicrobia bacterium]|nr:hypothetical protein [Verrucomicrobiota bacterium]
MQVINKQSVADSLVLENLAELHKVKEMIRIFQDKHGKSLTKFEKQVKKEPELFEDYDDYIDWKAAAKWQQELERRIEELRNGRFKVA